jgi:UDPglucose 6-dehydrogenase
MEEVLIGVIGGGFVGAAHIEALQKKTCYYPIVYDQNPEYYERFPEWKDLPGSELYLKDVVKSADIILVCVPTPPWDYSSDGKCGQANISIVHDVLRDISAHNAIYTDSRHVVCIKSTVPPGTTAKWVKEFPNLHLHFSCEFLTEAEPIRTLTEASRIVIGSDEKHDNTLIRMLCDINISIEPDSPRLISCTNTEAELIKYGSNIALLSKLMLFNYYYDIVGLLGCDYETVRKGIALDTRIGDSHTFVPGKDGLRGAGGSCFMKDIGALINVLLKMDMDVGLLQEVEGLNTLFRPEQDWIRNRYRDENGTN